MYLIDLKEICELMRANFSFESERLGLVESVVCLTVLGLAVADAVGKGGSSLTDSR